MRTPFRARYMPVPHRQAVDLGDRNRPAISESVTGAHYRYRPPEPDEPTCRLCGTPQHPDRTQEACTPCVRLLGLADL